MSKINEELLAGLRNNDGITSLQLAKLELGDQDLAILAEAAKTNTQLQSLDLTENQVGLGICVFENLRYLTSLFLSHNHIDDATATILARNPHLTELDVSYNCIAVDGVRAFVGNSRLTALNVTINNFGPAGAPILASSGHLKKLSCKSNFFGNAGALAFASNSVLTHLNLRSNHIWPAGAHAFVLHPTLQHLDLQDNRVGDTGAALLAANTKLRYLNLRQNHIGSEGAEALAKNTTLTSLNLSSNRIKNAGVQALAANGTLTTLILNRASFDRGALFYLEKNTVLNCFSFGNNGFNGPDKQWAESFTDLNRKAKKLSFIEALIEVAQGSRASQKTSLFKFLPSDLLLMILSYVAGNISADPKAVSEVSLFVFKLIRLTDNGNFKWCKNEKVKDERTNTEGSYRFFRRWNVEKLQQVKLRQAMMRMKTEPKQIEQAVTYQHN